MKKTFLLTLTSLTALTTHSYGVGTPEKGDGHALRRMATSSTAPRFAPNLDGATLIESSVQQKIAAIEEKIQEQQQEQSSLQTQSVASDNGTPSTLETSAAIDADEIASQMPQQAIAHQGMRRLNANPHPLSKLRAANGIPLNTTFSSCSPTSFSVSRTTSPSRYVSPERNLSQLRYTSPRVIHRPPTPYSHHTQRYHSAQVPACAAVGAEDSFSQSPRHTMITQSTPYGAAPRVVGSYPVHKTSSFTGPVCSLSYQQHSPRYSLRTVSAIGPIQTSPRTASVTQAPQPTPRIVISSRPAQSAAYGAVSYQYSVVYRPAQTGSYYPTSTFYGQSPYYVGGGSFYGPCYPQVAPVSYGYGYHGDSYDYESYDDPY